MAQLPDERSGSFSTICPYLHSREDPATAYAFPAVANRCYAPGGSKTLTVEYQAAYCLGPEHEQCPFYLAQERRLEGTNGPSHAVLAAQLARAPLEARWSSINLAVRSVRDTFQDWADRVAGAKSGIGLDIRDRFLGFRREVESARTLVIGRGVTSLVIAAVAIITLAGGVAFLLDTSNKGTPLTEASSVGSILTPTATLMATALPVDTQTNVIEFNPADTPVEMPTEEPTSTQFASPTAEPTSTSLPTATDTPTPTSSLTATRAVGLVKEATATFTPTIEATPSGNLAYAAPVLLDPPDGAVFQKTTTLRWSSDHELNPNEVFDVLVWHESMAQPAGIGRTTDKMFALDFRYWIYPQYSGRFFWTIRIKVVDGAYLSPANPPFSFIVNESGPVVPPAAPPPTSAPPAPQPTKPPPPKPSPPPP